MFVLLIALLLAVIFYVQFKLKRKHMYTLLKTLPDVQGSVPFLGNAHYFIGGPESIYENILKLCNPIEDKGGIAKVWIGHKPYVVLLNPEDAQTVLENCLEKDSVYKFLQNWLGNGLFVAPVDLWKMHRRVMLPVFHNRNIEDFIEVFGEQASVLVKRLKEKVGADEFDVFSYITSCTLDIVFETAMGERMNVQYSPDTPYLRARQIVMSIINMRFFKVWLQPDYLFKLTPYAKQQQDNIQLTHDFADQVIKKKRMEYENNNHRKGDRRDLLQLLLEREIRFTDEQLREHIDSITIAGNDTTALIISYALVMLGTHQTEQQKSVDELNQIFGESMRIPTKDDLNKMIHLDRVLKETMRLYTVVPLIARTVRTDTKLNSFTIPAGIGCVVLPFIMHKSKRLWGENADCFNSDRFLPEECVKRHPCAYIPFSYGLRNCIGRHFGMLAMKTILAMILREYKIKAHGYEKFKIEILLLPTNGHLITLEKRKC